jgi:hypothetical protein
MRKRGGKSALERHRCKDDGNIKIDIRMETCHCLEWYQQVQDRAQWEGPTNMLINFWVS